MGIPSSRSVNLRATAERDADRVVSNRGPVEPTIYLLATPGASWQPRRISVRGTELAIGRAMGEGDLALPDDPFVSRHHATLRFDRQRGTARLVDHSRSGTFVRGGPVTEAELAPGEVVRVGDSFFLLRFEEPSIAESDERDDFGLVGVSSALAAVRRSLRLIGRSDASALILGESGSGKELAARALHAASARSGPFVAINCGAIPETLAESELFGHVAGAYTGARVEAPGLFRSASGGTLFLDEIGELPLSLQPKLLRAVEERVVVPVGSTRPVPCDVRLVAATNREIRAADQFRPELLARISDFVIRMPPLRERPEDVLPILAALLETRGAELDSELIEALLLDSHPNNARDLRRIAVQLRLRGAGLERWDRSLLDGFSLGAPARRTTESPVRTVARAPTDHSVPSREELVELLRVHQGVVADVARASGRSRKQVYRWLEQRGLCELRQSLLDSAKQNDEPRERGRDTSQPESR
jgi:transcriptional regulator with AAA-type ATPase domain